MKGNKDGRGRSYIRTATKAATHPVRSKILKALKNSTKSTFELEDITKEDRLNLYHHLNLLKDVGLIKSELKDGKTKLFSLNKPIRPDVAVFIFDEDDINNNRELFNDFIDILSKIEGQKLPHKDKVSKAEICLSFNWSGKGHFMDMESLNSNMTMDLTEYRNASIHYRPKKVVKLLLVGEAPPPSQNHYIYWPEQMSRASLEDDRSFPATVFGHYFDRKPVDIDEYDQFLNDLQEMKIWILDLYEEPIKVTDRKLKNNRIEENFQKVKDSIQLFRHRLDSLALGELNDEQIIFLMPRSGYNREIHKHFPNSMIFRWIDFRLRRDSMPRYQPGVNPPEHSD